MTTARHDDMIDALHAAHSLIRILGRNGMTLDPDFPNKEFLRAQQTVEDILFPEGDDLLEDVEATWHPSGSPQSTGKELI